ncbi:MAG: hypothetical protein ACRDGQ_04585, partial [Candidatus Limnocylindrales bacterium]
VRERPAITGSGATWSTAALGSAIVTGASASFDSIYGPVAPHTGTVRLDITTTGTADQGVAWALSGTYKNGQTYEAGTWIEAAAGTYQVAFADGSGNLYGAGTATAVSGSSWTYLASADWTVAGGDTSGIKLIVRQTAGSGGSVYLDDAQSWNKATPASDIPSSTSVYDPDGRIVESVLPPASVSTSPLAAGSPEVTSVAYDALGQQVAVELNATNQYAAALLSGTAPVNRYPLDERSGTIATDRSASANLTYAAPLNPGAAAIDQALTGLIFDGSAQAATRSSADLTVTSNYSLEAWLRLDANPSATAAIVENGTEAAGYALAVNSAGHLVGVTNGVASDSGATLTPGT